MSSEGQAAGGKKAAVEEGVTMGRERKSGRELFEKRRVEGARGGGKGQRCSF